MRRETPMGLTVQGSTGTITKMYRRMPNGQIELLEPNPNDKNVEIVPGKGHYDALQVTGISDVFTMPSQFTNEDGTKKPDQAMRRWEITIRRGRNLDGRIFSVILPDHYTEKNASGRLIAGIRGEPPRAGERIELGDYLGNYDTPTIGVFSASLEHSDAGKPKIGTIDPPASAPAPQPAQAQMAPPPPPAPASAPQPSPAPSAPPAADPWGAANPFTNPGS